MITNQTINPNVASPSMSGEGATVAGAGAGLAVRVHALLPTSYASGPGVRAAIWVQGCGHSDCADCPPPMRSPTDGTRMAVNYLFRLLVNYRPTLEGVTIGGGEPFDQQTALVALLQRIRAETTLSCILCSWHSWETLQQQIYAPLRGLVDVLYTPATATHAPRSTNGGFPPRMHCLTNRYTRDDVLAFPRTEVTITVDGNVIMSGLHPDEWP